MKTETLTISEQLEQLQRRYDEDMAMMNERLQERTEGLMLRLQEKTLREGFVAVERVQPLVQAGKDLYEESLNYARRLEKIICEVADFMDAESGWDEAGAVAGMVTREAKSIRSKESDAAQRVPTLEGGA